MSTPTRAASTIDLEALARVGRALADDTRRRILARLAAGPAYPADLADTLGCGRPNVSNHIACLRGCGLVVAEREGRRTRYELADSRLADVLAAMGSLELVPVPDDDCEHQP